ncbi:MAG: RNA polymerase sigma factor RpoH [Gammaproteobacteria bacterium]|jgi:RNA polymerase sigma-32 factor
MGTKLQTISLNLPIGSLDSYIQRIQQFPILSATEEYDLAIRFKRDNNLDAARRLVMAHLRFVVKVARGYMGYGLSLADLIQEGNIGLMKAVKRFDPKVGVRLVSFAVHWIKAEIHEFILRNWRIVKVATTKAQRKLFFNLRSAKKRLGWFKQKEVEDVAAKLDVTQKNVIEMEARLSAHDAAFDGNDNSESCDFSPARTLADNSMNPARLLESEDFQADSKARFYEAFAKLDTRSQTILQKRWLNEKKTTLQDLAVEFKISAERIRQLEQQAMQKIKDLL